MQQQLHSKLAPVRRRQRILFSYRLAVYCLLPAAGVGIVAGMWKLAASGSWSIAPVVAIVVGLPVLGLLCGLLWKHPWHAAAEAIDAHYQLKDRSITALEFADQNKADTWRELQLADASRHLDTVDPKAVVPFRMPRALPTAFACLAAAIVLLAWPRESNELAAAAQEPYAPIVAVADEILEDLKDLEKEAATQQNEELKALIEELQDQAQEMKKPEVDAREALATLSEMQASLAKQQAAYNDAAVDAQLKSLGEAMSAAQPLAPAGEKLEQGKFEEAAEKLEKLQDAKLEKREAKAAQEKMNKVASAMKDAGMGQMSDAVSQSAEGIGSGDKSSMSKGMGKLSTEVKKHSARKKTNELLKRQLNRFSECKSKCSACQGSCKNCGGNCKEGQCNKNSLAKGLDPRKSNKASKNWGKKSSGNNPGEKTNLDSKRDEKQITGNAGDGPSEFETTNSPEGREDAARQYKEVFKDYEKLSEAVLDSEPIPLGQRQTIRKYFELIRPQTSDLIEQPADKSADKPADKPAEKPAEKPAVEASATK